MNKEHFSHQHTLSTIPEQYLNLTCVSACRFVCLSWNCIALYQKKCFYSYSSILISGSSFHVSSHWYGISVLFLLSFGFSGVEQYSTANIATMAKATTHCNEHERQAFKTASPLSAALSTAFQFAWWFQLQNVFRASSISFWCLNNALKIIMIV